jgi:DNA-binding IclR family transcriptional regulator
MKDFGMFTEMGNNAVVSLVELATKAMLPWSTVESMLEALSQNEVYAEATDTVVREAVYCELYGA